jgi:alpha-1,3-rhamnosyl/mannosyltransferase
MARCVALAQGDFCWLLSADDALADGALQRIYAEIETARDVYLVNRLLCDRNLKPRQAQSWLARDFGDFDIDLGDDQALVRYFDRAVSIGALFSYMSTIIFKRQSWDRSVPDPSVVGSNYAHIHRLFCFRVFSGKMRYVAEPLVLCRGDNDSFLSLGLLGRHLIDLRGFNLIAQLLFPHDSRLKARFKEVVNREHHWVTWVLLRSITRDDMEWQEVRRAAGIRLWPFDNIRHGELGAPARAVTCAHVLRNVTSRILSRGENEQHQTCYECDRVALPATGIAAYTRNLAEALLETGRVEPFFFYGLGWSPKVRDVADVAVPAVDRLRMLARKILPHAYELRRFVQQRSFRRGVRAYRPHIYHDPNYLAYRFDGPIVITVHDLSHVRYPETHPAERVRAMNKFLPRAIEMASEIIVDSHFVKGEVVNHFRVDPRKVHAIHLGVGDDFSQRPVDVVRDALAGFGLTHKSYIFAVGTLEPRKNLIQAIDAYVGLPETIRTSTPLVIAGMKGWLSGDIEARLRKHEERGEVRWLGYVPARILPMLYSGASMLVYPSLYEGFGLPVLEAMASGIPVITSNRASLPEVAGDVGFAVDPHDVEALRACMRSLIEDNEEATRRGAMGIARARQFTWQACAQQTLVVYRKAIDGYAARQRAVSIGSSAH